MRSTARIKNHPLHPLLIPFPLAFFIGTLIFDALGVAKQDFTLLATGYYLNVAGIIGAIVAAVPGIIEYIFTVPPKSSAKKRAAKHGIINSTALLLFIASLLHKRSETPSDTIVLSVESVGVILLMIGGWLGGTLVYRNEIGVDRRYANSGKWNEERIKSSDLRVRVGEANEIGIDQMKLVHINGKRIAITKTQKGFAAFDDRCPHKGGSLAGGTVICGTVQCPWHGSQFDVHNGAIKAGPGKEGIKTFPIEVDNGTLYLLLPKNNG